MLDVCYQVLVVVLGLNQHLGAGQACFFCNQEGGGSRGRGDRIPAGSETTRGVWPVVRGCTGSCGGSVLNVHRIDLLVAGPTAVPRVYTYLGQLRGKRRCRKFPWLDDGLL